MVEILTIVLALVFFILLILAYLAGIKIGALRRDKFWEKEIPEHRKDAIIKSRAVLGGQFSEQLAPYLPDFEFSPTECKFLGKPVDFIVFKGMDEKKIDEVVFVEVKSANSKLSSQEKNLKETIEKKRVRWEEYRVPEDLTKKNFDEDTF
ncbi:MAG: Holliday junction resolvase-like protein [Nanoarchaeota archaeon]